MSSSPRKQHRRRDYEDGGGIDDDGQPNPIPEPALFQPVATTVPPGPDKVEVLVRRYRVRAKLWHDADVEVTQCYDYVTNFTLLAQAMREAVLAERCVRWGADGIEVVPGDPPEYRRRIWDPNENRHIDLGRGKTRDAAVNLIADWYHRYCGIDVRVTPPAWLKEVLGDAIQVQGEYSDSQNGVSWEVAAASPTALCTVVSSASQNRGTKCNR